MASLSSGSGSKIGPLLLGAGLTLLGLLLLVSTGFSYLILKSGYVVVDGTITMFSPSGLSQAWMFIVFLGAVGVLLVGSGSWFIGGSLGTVPRRKKAARYALVVGVCFVAAIFIGSFSQPVFATIPSSQTAIISQFSCSASAYVVESDGTNYYGFNSNACALEFGGPINAGGVTGTDASRVINSVFGALPPSGGIVQFSADTFVITDTIEISNGATMQGAGMDSTVFSAASTLNAPVIENAAGPVGNGGVTLEDFMVTGSNDASANTGADGIYWYAYRAGTALTSFGLAAYRISVNHMPGDGLDLLYSTPYTNAVSVVANSIFFYNNGWGMYLTAPDSKYVDDYVNNQQSGANHPTLEITGSTQYGASDSTFVDDYIGGSAMTGGVAAEVVVSNVRGIQFSDTIIDNSQGYCLYLYGASAAATTDYITFVGGQITDCGESANTYTSVLMGGYVHDVTFSGVDFKNTLGYPWDPMGYRPNYLLATTTSTVGQVEFIGCQIMSSSFSRGVVPVSTRGVGQYLTESVRWVDNPGFNPVSAYYKGPIPDPIRTGHPNTATIGLAGDGKTVTANTNYFVSGVDIKLSCSGGRGVRITEKTGVHGSIIQTFSSCSAMGVLFLWVGEAVNFGAFSVAPTVTVWGD